MAHAELHREKVSRIATQIKDKVRDGQPVHIQKGGVSHFVPLPNDFRFRTQAVDVSSLNQILEINVEERYCLAEPGVTFSELVRETLKRGLVPTVVPELEGISLGGAVAGCSIESMSYRYGGFHDSCLEYEVITGEGEVLVCSPQNEPLAVEMLHGSYGTLAILTRLKFRLIPAKPFVRMEYRKFDHFQAFREELITRSRVGDFEFVDAIIHDRNTFVVCLGRFVDKVPYVSDYRWLKIFYKSTASRAEDYLTSYDYFFRYDAECHWLTRRVPAMETLPARFLLGKWVLGSTNLIRWSKRLDRVMRLQKRPDVVCDVFIPSKRFEEFYQWYERDFDFFPLWVIPYRIPKLYGWVDKSYGKAMQDDLMMDCAVYGKPNTQAHVDYSEVLEKKTYQLNGIKTLISRNHHTREEFWRVYHRENYQRAKLLLDPRGTFRELYEKFHPAP